MSVTYEGGNATDSASVQSVTIRSTLNRRRTITQRYEAATRTLTTTSPADRQTQTFLDERGRPSMVAVPGVLPISYTYDSRGRPTTVTQGDRQVTVEYLAGGFDVIHFRRLARST